VSDKTGWGRRSQQLGTHIATVWPLVQALGPAKENKYRLESRNEYRVSGYWELKRKFRVTVDSL